jgi:Tfp pilus assembly protein PilN
MHDMNFFSVYKRQQAKGSAFKTFIVVLIVVLLLINGGLVGGGLYLFGQLEAKIQEHQAFIGDPVTQDAIKQAEQIKREADLTAQYLKLLNSVDTKLDQMDFINTELLNNIRVLTPPDVIYTSAQITGLNINLTCEAADVTAAMDMYHTFKNSPLFVNVIMSGITINQADNTAVFTMNCLLTKEEADLQ